MRLKLDKCRPMGLPPQPQSSCLLRRTTRSASLIAGCIDLVHLISQSPTPRVAYHGRKLDEHPEMCKPTGCGRAHGSVELACCGKTKLRMGEKGAVLKVVPESLAKSPTLAASEPNAMATPRCKQK